MSEHISIQEGGQSRAIGNLNRLETETADGTGSCFWVPESERELESEHIMSNGDYTPKKYAFDELDVNVMEPIGEFEIGLEPIDPVVPEISLPNIRIPDLNIDLTIDPLTGLPDLTIDGEKIELPGLGDLDLDADMDISIDGTDLDISGVDMDGLDIGVNIDLNTLDIDVTDLPDEIRIMHVPTKTAYKDGEEIDLDGLVVQAYRGGEVWNDASGRYIDGYVPVHELIVEPSVAIHKNKYRPDLLVFEAEWDQIDSYYKTRTHRFYQNTLTIKDMGIVFRNENGKLYAYTSAPSLVRPSEPNCHEVSKGYNQDTGWSEKYEYDTTLDNYGNTGTVDGKYFNWAGVYFISYISKEWHSGFKDTFENEKYTIIGEPLILDRVTYRDLCAAAYEDATATVISWPRPKDNKLLTASFDISVEESEGGADSGGTHYSGKFDESPSGHWGGTTISGDYGGSHHSGKF